MFTLGLIYAYPWALFIYINKTSGVRPSVSLPMEEIYCIAGLNSNVSEQ